MSHSTGADQVSFDEFFDGCMRLRGQARSIDMRMLMYLSKALSARLMHFIASTDGRLTHIEGKLGVTQQGFFQKVQWPLNSAIPHQGPKNIKQDKL